MTKEKKSGSRRQRQKSVEEEEKEIKKQVIHEKRNISFSHLSRSQVALEVFLRTCVGLFVFVSVLSLLPQNASYSQCLSFSFHCVSSWVAIPSLPFFSLLFSASCVSVFSHLCSSSSFGLFGCTFFSFSLLSFLPFSSSMHRILRWRKTSETELRVTCHSFILCYNCKDSK